MNVDVGARKLGGKLVAEVEEEDLSSVFESLRKLQLEKQQSTLPTFSIPSLESLLPSSPSPPILELISPPPTHHPSGSGKTSLIYLTIAHAILPPTFSSSIPLSGQSATIMLLDPLHHFSVSRLAGVMLNLIATSIRESGRELKNDATTSAIKNLVSQSLTHVHIFRPQSWPSFLATLRSLPDYLLDATRHKSMQRRVHSLVLEDVDAFVWSIRNAASTDPSTSTNNLSSASTLLTTLVSRLTTQFSCAAILTSHSTASSSFRPAIPATWPAGMNVTRLAVRRVEVLKFAPAVSVEEAEGERAQRWGVVSKGRFECWRVGGGIGGRDGGGEGFVFRVGRMGVEIEVEGAEK